MSQDRAAAALDRRQRVADAADRGSLNGLATPAGFEPAATRLEGECSIQLSYGVAGIGRVIAPGSVRGNLFRARVAPQPRTRS